MGQGTYAPRPRDKLDILHVHVHDPYNLYQNDTVVTYFGPGLWSITCN